MWTLIRVGLTNLSRDRVVQALDVPVADRVLLDLRHRLRRPSGRHAEIDVAVVRITRTSASASPPASQRNRVCECGPRRPRKAAVPR